MQMKRFFAILLSVLMVLSVIPGAALAEEIENAVEAAKSADNSAVQTDSRAQSETLRATFGVPMRGEPNPDWPENDGTLYGYCWGDSMGEAGWYFFNPADQDDPVYMDESETPVYAAAFNGGDGYIYGYTERTFFKVDLDGIVIAERAIENMVSGMAYNCADGNMYAYDSYEGLGIVNLETGELQSIGADITMSSPRLAIDAHGMAYLLDFSTTVLYAYNIESGIGCTVGTVNTMGGYPCGMCFNVDTGVLYLSVIDQGGMLLSVNPNTAESTTVRSFDYDFYGLTSIIPQDFTTPETVDMQSITLSRHEITMDCYALENLSASVLPANTTYALYAFTSSDESVATISDTGVITSRGAGTTVIRAAGLFAPDITDECVVTVREPVYPEHEENMVYGFLMSNIGANRAGFYKINMETGALNLISTALPNKYMNTAYFDPNAGLVRGFYKNVMCTFTLEGVLIDSCPVNGLLKSNYIYGAAFDIATNTPYLLVSSGGAMSSTKTLYRFDVERMTLAPVAVYDGELKIESIAVDRDGNMYGLECQGSRLYSVNKQTGELTLIGDTGVQTLFLQSITYDLAADKLYFARYKSSLSVDDPASGDFYELDPQTAQATLIRNMNKMHFCGLFATIPEDYERPNGVPVTGVSFSVGGMNFKMGTAMDLYPFLTVYPANATNKNVIFSSSDTSVGYVNEAGVLITCGEGTAIITATTVDGGFTASITLNCEGYDYPETDNMIHGFVESTTYDFLPRGPVMVDPSDGSAYQSTLGLNYLAYAQEFCNRDGFVYGYTENTFFKATTGGVIVRSVPSASPAYDMAFDRTSGIMYALANDANGVRGLYTVNLETGERTLVGNPEGGQTLCTLAINGSGMAYAFEIMTGALYRVNLSNGQLMLFNDTGCEINLIASAVFDPNDDTTMYFAAFGEEIMSGIFKVRIKTDGSASFSVVLRQSYVHIGIQGLYFITGQNDNGNTTTPVTTITPQQNQVTLPVGASHDIVCSVLPELNDDALFFLSSDSSVIRVAENGSTVWAVGEGSAEVTVLNNKGTVAATVEFNVTAYRKPVYTGKIGGYYAAMSGSSGISGWAMYSENGSSSFIRKNRLYTVYGGDFNCDDGFVYVCEGRDYATPAPNSFWGGSPNTTTHEYWLNKMSVDGVVVSRVRCDKALHNLAYDPVNGLMYCIYVDNTGSGLSFGTVNLETGAVTFISRLEGDYYSIAVDNNGIMYSVELGTGILYRIDKGTGVGTRIGSTGLAYQGISSMAVDRSTNTLYFADIRIASDNSFLTGVYEINPETAAAEQVFDPRAEVTSMFIVSYPAGSAEQGDVNGDGIVNIEDALLVMRYAMQLIDGDELDLSAADMNDDGRVEIGDALVILRSAMTL